MNKILSCLFIFGSLTGLSAQTLSPNTNAPAKLPLAWDPVSDSTVVGYNVYYGSASATYTNMIKVGNSTTVTVTNLIRGVTYYLAATSYDSTGLESPFSNEIIYRFNGSLTPPVLRLAVGVNGLTAKISGTGDPWQNYAIDTSIAPDTWLEMGSVTSDRNGDFDFVDIDPGPVRFYRARGT